MDRVVEDHITDQEVVVYLEELVIHLQFLLHKEIMEVLDLHHLLVAVLAVVAVVQLQLEEMHPNHLQPTV